MNFILQNKNANASYIIERNEHMHNYILPVDYISLKPLS